MRAKGGIDLAPSALSTALVQDSVTIRQVMLAGCIFSFGVYFITEPTHHVVFLHGTLVLFQRFDRKRSPATFVPVAVDSESIAPLPLSVSSQRKQAIWKTDLCGMIWSRKDGDSYQLTDRFHITHFSALEQTRCCLVACAYGLVTVAVFLLYGCCRAAVLAHGLPAS